MSSPPASVRGLHVPDSPPSLSDLPLSPTTLQSPLLQAVEPVLMMPDEEDVDEEDDTQTTHYQHSQHHEDEEIRMLPPSAMTSAAAGTGGPTSAHPLPSSTRSVDEPKSASEKDGADDDEEEEELQLDATPAHPSVSHYATSLWHAVPAVIAQSESGRNTSRALGGFLRAKADLDREYASNLRRLTSKWATDLPVRPSAHQGGSMLAGLCALRNLVLAQCTNLEILGEKVDEIVADPFIEAAAAVDQQVRAMEKDTRGLTKELEGAMEQLASCKRALQKACAELAALNAETSGINTTGGSSVSSSSKSSTGINTSGGASEWMADLLGSVAPKAFRPSASELSHKRIPALDAKYTAAIRTARSVRARFDREIAQRLQGFEQRERERLQATKQMAQGYTDVHRACFMSSARHMEAVHKSLDQCSPSKDVEMFVAAQLRRMKSDRKAQPPPLPVYRTFKGHPQYAATKHRDAKAPAAAARKKRQQGKGAEQQQQREVDEPLTDSENDDAESDLSLSDATDSEQDELDGSDDDDDNDAADDDAVAEEALSPTSVVSNSPEQLEAEAHFTHLLAALRDLPLSARASPSPVSPTDMEGEMDVAAQMLESHAGRVALAAVLKRTVNTSGGTAATTEAAEQQQQDGASPVMDARNGLDAFEPAPVPSSPEVAAVSADATAAAVAAAPVSDPNAVLVLGYAAFEHLSSLLLRLLDTCMASMHAQPAISILRTSRRIVLASSLDRDVPTEEAEAEADGSSLPPVPESVLSRLSAHDACSSLRLWEMAFFESLARARQRRAPLHPWYTDEEQSRSSDTAAALALKLLDRYAHDMLSLTQLSDADVVSFVDKLAHTHELDTRGPEGAMASLLALPCFKRLGLTEMPSQQRAREAKQRLQAQQKQQREQRESNVASSVVTPSGSRKAAVAMPVAQRPSGATEPAAASASSSASASAVAPAASVTRPSSVSPASSVQSSSSARGRAGRSALHAPRPPFDAEPSDEEDEDVSMP